LELSTETIELNQVTPSAHRRIRQRLPFVLPDFNRHSWTSELMREVWEPRIARIVRAWVDAEWRSVAEGVRDCGLLWISPDLLPTLIPQWEAAHLSAIQLKIEARNLTFNGAVPTKTAGMICVVLGPLDKIQDLSRAWAGADHERVGVLLGYPRCCRTFFHEVWVDQRCIDTTWEMGARTTSRGTDHTIQIEPPAGVPPLANILWRWLGVRAVPHLPCRFDCSESIALGTRLLEIADKAGYHEEVRWISEILAWPVEWSGLHGIAELKSPLFKLSTSTDATSEKWVVQWMGTSYPEGGPSGLHFPYQKPKHTVLTSLRSIEQHVHETEQHADSGWRYRDNGFSSAEAMETLHRPLVELARTALSTESGNVLDLGCGNGMLLAKLCAQHSGLTPYGVDTNGIALSRARQLAPNFAGNFIEGNFFDSGLWDGDAGRYVLALLMMGRLLEVPPEKANEFLARLHNSCARILVYTYPDWGEQPLHAIAAQFGLQLEDSGCGTAAYLRLRSN
jgi:hypothetical protein